MKLLTALTIILSLIRPVFAQNHLLISEIQVSPGDQEFIEIFNPNPFSINLDQYHLSDYNTYYEVVTGNYTTESSDFLVKFPAGAQIDSGGVIVVALDGSNFNGSADFEIRSTSSVSDMVPLYVGTSASLSNTELVILFFWNGQTDLVSDVDYGMWGDNLANLVDKSGVSIDGPDPDNTPSTFLNDTPVNNQNFYPTAPITGKSIERISVREEGETFVNGNGISGHNETSEPIDQNFALLNIPTPGSTLLIIPSGNGSGLAYATPDSVLADSTVNLQFIIKGTVTDLVTDISLAVPSSWAWSGSSGDVQLTGAGFVAAGFSVNGNVISINNAQISLQDSGIVDLASLTAPSQPEVSQFLVETAISGGTPAAISQSPEITVYAPVLITPIADIQANPSAYTTVTIQGVVTLGAGKTITTRTDAYIQDNSGRGMNIFSFDPPDPDIVRGNLLRVTGEVTEFQGVTEITNYTLAIISTGNLLPAPLELTTQQANNTELEGTFLKVTGSITSIETFADATNFIVNDGTGDVLVRVWASTGVDVSGYSVNDVVTVQAVADLFNSEVQLIPAYNDDIFIPGSLPGDGSGMVTVSPDSVGTAASGISLSFEVIGEIGFNLTSISVNIPSDWQWAGGQTNVQLAGNGFSGSTVTINGFSILIENASVSDFNNGTIQIDALTSPPDNKISLFSFRTAVSGGVLTAVQNIPQVIVGSGLQITPIAAIQANPSAYTAVIVEGIVTLGSGRTITSRTDAYIQDNSGRGINLFNFDPPHPDLQRGNRVRVAGTVEEYQGVTEITDFTVDLISMGNLLPDPLILTTNAAGDVTLEGTYLRVTGIATEIQTFSEATNITVDDGSGGVTVRVWGTTGINLNFLSAGDSVVVQAVMDIFNNESQLIPGYQDEIHPPGVVPGDGNGFAILDRDSIDIGTSGIDLGLSVWSTETDTIRKIEVILPSNWIWPGQTEAVELSGRGFTNAQKKVITEYGEYYLELTNCQVTELDTGIIIFKNMDAPFESVYSYFWVKTAVRSGEPQFIGDNPRIVVGNDPVYLNRDIQINSSQFREPVTVRGVVTVGSGILRTDRTSAFLQDNSGYGLNINQSGPPDDRFQRGFFMTIEGPVSEFREVTQIDPTLVTIIDSTAEIPDPIALSTGEVNDPRWDGTLVRVPRVIGQDNAVVTDKYTTSSQAPFDFNIVVNDGSGPLTLRVWGTTNINLDSVSVNQAIIATGIGSVFVSDGLPLYQILPAYQEHIRLDATFQPSLESVALEIPPHPFVPDRGERINISYNVGSPNNRITLRIFDLGGRLITTLLDQEQSELLEGTVEWDGRDKLLDLVPLGTYLCHLEVMEPKSGKKKNEIAPIVIGTILKK